MLKNKKSKEQKLRKALLANKDFLLERLGEEWDKIQHTAAREELVRRAKTAGLTMVKNIMILTAIAGGLTAAVIAPNLFGAIGRIAGRRGFFKKQGFRDSIRYLRKKKYINVTRDTKRYSIKLTDKGADVLLSSSLRDLRIRSQPKWDGVWHIVMFDIPNRFKWAREVFRERLKAMGLYQLQESVFVYPYLLDEEVDFLMSLLNIPEFVRVVRSRNISNEEDLREVFSL